MKKRLLVLLITLLSSPTFAQFSEKAHVSFYGNLGFPMGEFRQTIQNSIGGNGIGFGTNILLNPKKEAAYSPVLLGMEVNYLHLGTEKTPESTFLPKLKTSYNYITLGPVVRALLSQREEGIVPFVDGFVGMKLLNTKTRIDNTIVDTLLDQEYLESLLSTNYEGLGYGLGVGFFTRKLDKGGINVGNSFYLKLNYAYGDRLTYVRKGSIAVDSEGFITYDNGKTQTGMITLQVGIMLY
ncbi:MAG: hypothetical protein MUE75_04120 [Algoriphagus sp.]|jgi:hypothetical protein|nr:hypothetical protein [Algoriphagus sp.]